MIFVTIILDGVGIGEQPDAAAYGDEGSDTLGHVLGQQKPSLPNLQRMGLGNIRSFAAVPPTEMPSAMYGRMQERSAGKDSTTGHWELAGVQLEEPFPTYPNGFPDEVITSFCEAANVNAALGNRPESGTVIIDEFGPEHMATGFPIVYTSADSVFQIAAHLDVVPIETLYEWCQLARESICVGPHGVGRVIARPFEGQPGAFRRRSDKRKDFSRLPEALTLQEALQHEGVHTVSVGKVADLFGGVGFDDTHKTGRNAVGIQKTIDAMRDADASGQNTFIWTNLIDFDQEYGHRNNPEGFARSLEEFDAAQPDILAVLPRDSRLVVTADHGNDPTTESTDHSREFVPLLYYGSSSTGSLGTRHTFADHAASAAAFFGVYFTGGGISFEN